MKALPILTHPAPSLRVRSTEVDPKTIGTPEFQAFVDDLFASLAEEENGIGIAAPQVGNNIRVILVAKNGIPKAYINPEITKCSETKGKGEEGCLSVPEVWGIVERCKRVSVTALDRHGRRVTLDCRGIEAVCFQHEIDHLDGILFIDKVIEFTRGQEKLEL